MFLCVTLLALTGFVKSTAVTERFKVVGPAAPLIVDHGEDVVLPCSLQPKVSAVDMSVEWRKLEMTTLTVHLYKDFKDRLDEQAEIFRGRTSLSKEGLKTGNTSLKLSAVQPSDEGVYICLIKSRSGYDDVTVRLKIREEFSAWNNALNYISLGLTLFVTYILKGSLSPVIYSAIAYKVRHMNVKNEWNLMKYNTTEEGYRRLIAATTNCRKARLAGNILTEQIIEALFEALLSENSCLKELDLSYSDLQGSGLEKLSDGLKRLKILRLAGFKFTKHLKDTLAAALQAENSSLKELDIIYSDLPGLKMEKFSAGLMKLEILRSLLLINYFMTF
ncbi:myelin-oligodendrocyte glycoprotein-like [Hoplias malabaricus]|uniref:myelin-oligodendrocyte glycoprotein-like n=1 Tax=Hoplias malabaricus TaxID=27720 RepID=UPI003461E9E7